MEDTKDNNTAREWASQLSNKGTARFFMNEDVDLIYRAMSQARLEGFNKAVEMLRTKMAEDDFISGKMMSGCPEGVADWLESKANELEK